LESPAERVVELAAMLLGWPAIALSVICFGAAVRRRSRPLAFAGCCLALPMFLYLTMTPGFRYLAPLGFVGLVLATWRVRDGHRLVTLALLLPAFGQILLLAYGVITQ
jgi:hypothetical protein